MDPGWKNNSSGAYYSNDREERDGVEHNNPFIIGQSKSHGPAQIQYGVKCMQRMGRKSFWEQSMQSTPQNKQK